jgi:hypothetical protein
MKIIHAPIIGKEGKWLFRSLESLEWFFTFFTAFSREEIS